MSGALRLEALPERRLPGPKEDFGQALRRRTVLGAAALAMLFAAGCASPRRPSVRVQGAARAHWSGRLSLRVDSDPEQNFFASFDLRGDARRGELALTTPLGNTLAQLRWSPEGAILRDSSGTRPFNSVDALVEAATGTAIPVQALFDWLDGRPSHAPGWTANLGQVSEGRLQAKRNAPLPTAELRVVFEQP